MYRYLLPLLIAIVALIPRDLYAFGVDEPYVPLVPPIRFSPDEAPQFLFCTAHNTYRASISQDQTITAVLQDNATQFQRAAERALGNRAELISHEITSNTAEYAKQLKAASSDKESLGNFMEKTSSQCVNLALKIVAYWDHPNTFGSKK